MKVLIFGNGYVGNKFHVRIPNSIISKADIADAAAVQREIDAHSPDAVVNCAGKTGKPNVDWCEDHKLETLHSNVLGPVVLADVCLKSGIYLVHVGSGCVYEGDNNKAGFSEDDAPNFFGSYYSRSKATSEQALRDFPVLQVRLRMPFDSQPGPRNLITKLANYPNIINIPNSISNTDEFITATLALMAQEKTGIYNVTNPGAITQQEIMDLYAELVQPGRTYKIISLDELYKFTKAKRSNCVLSTAKLEAEGIRLRPVRQAVRETLIEYSKNIPR